MIIYQFDFVIIIINSTYIYNLKKEIWTYIFQIELYNLNYII